MSKLNSRGRESHENNLKENATIKKKGFKMEILWFVAIIAVYFLLQAVILPKLGIST